MGTITVTNLGKAYKKYPTRWSRLVEWMDPRRKDHHTLHWVLRDVNFSVRSGEALGIIGINGAGKSTLLKMIVGTTQPTVGSVSMTGRVAALLELGMGFHPDFTGRQNVMMAGQLLGYSVEELIALMPEIEAFAEIGEYIDQPVRVYSSGMQVRLAFSVATARRPDVLIVDEALSVGDAYFQHKSFDRIREFRKQGTTLLLVAHDKAAIQAICDRAILLNAGRLEMEGAPEAVMDYYNAMLADRKNHEVKQAALHDGTVQTVSGTGEAVIEEVVLLDDSGQPAEVVGVGQPVALRVKIKCVQTIPELVVGYMIKDRLGQTVFGTNTYHLKQVLVDLHAGQMIELDFAFLANLGVGSYSVSVALHTGDAHVVNNYQWRDRALVFDVVNIKMEAFVGVAWLPTTVRSVS
ncbi:Teichoic acids export ATP-binding protein TagH [Burkholderia multivorans]|uniref:ABC transporter ATP-binding protein n=1 Tax=Burkholderia multivorans TaxID=87883 RepID=UPI0015883072|nr:ABC transporter ATP-binding protein [Burkholderia multivorans]MBU9262809.1 ABC transporter ATP-binding protein [Burkholderia multivorans]MBU9572360.1 ABC transporter ATP-binding protein [Burkholderia multivorans]MDR8877924.1 Teichoic acids export ATP-binding protein TagH [Burkholderia multivorans]MDR8884195.1 Teichoic acids export ATP-binding protein TagH [Burkholderia multivorans]MDR8890602.1 Teichoic acids export ATP-binding protein TagH [Burkholderia multivorans]